MQPACRPPRRNCPRRDVVGLHREEVVCRRTGRPRHVDAHGQIPIAGTSRKTGSLTASAPGGMVTEDPPLNVSGRSDPGTMAAPVLRIARCAAPMLSGAVRTRSSAAHARPGPDARVDDLAQCLVGESGGQNRNPDKVRCLRAGAPCTDPMGIARIILGASGGRCGQTGNGQSEENEAESREATMPLGDARTGSHAFGFT